VHFEQEILAVKELHHSDTDNFPLYKPSEDEILAKLKSNFDFESMETFLTSRRNHLFQVIQHAKEQYLEINTKQIQKVHTRKEAYLAKSVVI